MKRSRSQGVWLPATLLMVVALGSTAAWKTLRTKGLGRPFKVLKLTAQPAADNLPNAPLALVSDPAARVSRDDLARRIGTALRTPAPPPVRRIEGTSFIASVDHASGLSPHQRARLTSTFKLAATLQKTIDATADLETRADLQLRLDDQVRTRLRMILPEEALPLMGDLAEAGGPVAFEFGEHL